MQPTRPADERPNLLRPLRLKPVQREAPRFASGDVEDDAADAPDESSQGEILERPLVYVRVRPDGADNAKSEGGIKVDGTNVTYPVPKKDRKNTISVEHVFEETASQEDVFQKVVREQVMTYILQGFRACIFAFGITGSGKSYTILGNGEQVESQGLLQRTIQDLFAQDLDNFSMSMQAIQLHRHRFEDLGVAQKELVKVNSTMHVDKTDCSEHKFDSAAPALEWLDGALTRRNVKATGGNKVSSRSHLVVRVKLQFTLDGEGRNAVLDVVDLAGSERIRTDLDEETSKDHIAIQAGLSCLQNCIESKIHNVKLPQNQQRLVPFTHFPLTKLLAPDFTGDAIVAMILTFSTKLDRAAEVAETLHFTSRMLGFRIAAKKQGVTVQAQKFEDLMARALPRPSESQKPELPMTKAVSVKAQKLHELEKQQNEELREEVRRLRLQLEQLEKEVVSPLGALASELKELAKASETQPASADLISRARKVMQDMQEKYPQDVKMIWANWSEDLQPGKIKGDLKEFAQHFRQLEHRVVQHEKDICSLMERRAALQTMAKNGEAGELHRRQLEVLDALLAEATEGRPSLREFLSSWEQQWRDLLEKRQELRDLEAAAASSMENSEARHMPLAETLDADWAQWSNGGVSEIERLIEEFLGDAIWIGSISLSLPLKAEITCLGPVVLNTVLILTRSAFFAEVRQSLYRFSEASQKELVEFFTELKAEVVKLVDSMTQEVSVWLDEERVASAWQNHAKQARLLALLALLVQGLCQAAEMPRGNKPRERGTVVAWKTAEYGFVKREGRHNDDIQLHVANAKGERFKKYVRRYGMQAGVRVKFDVDFEEEDDFAQRIVSFAAVAFVPSLLLSVAVFPPSNEALIFGRLVDLWGLAETALGDGIFLPNMLAAFSYGVGLTMAVTFILLLRISSFVDPLNKNLKATSYVVEDSRSQRSLAGDGGYYSSSAEEGLVDEATSGNGVLDTFEMLPRATFLPATRYAVASVERRQKTSDEIQRDQLLGEYQTGPAMSRLRKYLLGAAAVSALGWIVGSVSGGEMSLREDEEDERKCGTLVAAAAENSIGTRCIPGLMTDDTNIEMNGYRLFR
ncbi:unnamed protein product [Cladocopium goreaui]|uniref:Kinesin-like protein n=1 Tax=Cladocopium goreaui TaxID=2562237 RepID=A0A9P1FV50_9DINO|nr:unnamed protein product [Cladocopium goreaui]